MKSALVPHEGAALRDEFERRVGCKLLLVADMRARRVRRGAPKHPQDGAEGDRYAADSQDIPLHLRSPFFGLLNKSTKRAAALRNSA